MKFSWQWIKELINLPDITLEESIKKLTLAGFEIETINNKKDINDTTVELNITANRSDAASIIGITRELQTIFKTSKNTSVNTNTKIQTKDTKFHTINLDKSQFTNKNLSDIKITIIKNINLQNSPEWLINKLKGCEITQKDTLSNISKYINIKWGQDIEIFDLDQIDKKKFQEAAISIRHVNIKEDTKPIIISDENTNNFIESLTYKNSIISLLGIKSNSEFYCNGNTSSIIIFGHICKPQYIKNTTQILKYKTEKSQKHIKGLSRNDFIKAYDETLNLISELTNTCIDNYSKYIWHQQNTQLTNILINTKKIQYILGTINQERNLNTEEIIDILRKLNFEPKQCQNLVKVNIPEYRKYDIKREIDIIEEIGRIYGFNHFIDKLPQKHKQGNISKVNILIRKIRHILQQLGLHEITHYSLNNINNEHNKFYISIHNPLQEDQKYLRNYLLYNLLNTLKYNKKQKNIFMECFEIGKTFQQQKSKNNKKQIYYEEKIHIAGIIGKNNFSRRLWSEQGKTLSWFQAKGLIETLFEQIHAEVEWINYKSNSVIILKSHENIINMCHPYKFAILTNTIHKTTIGIFGELNNKYSKEINQNCKNYIFELDIIELMKTIHIKKHLSYIFTKYSLYPSVTRNICLKLNKNITAESIKEILISHNKLLIESIHIIDEYYANNYKQESRNINYKIIYRSLNKTLNDNDINEIDSKLNQVIKYINTTIS
uniref:phenylalanine-tRNA ligase beta subunit n=1 Tax=Hypnea nidifica TaxID=673448 RepID=UPI0027D9DA16|nr:phenylalanine-tRNA ligase beta subunit [Hypnea nidifica]WCH54424.1 phenylalanine-tRNA ligase beta subunit [Hypnea nidifica]